ncbi:hypothetical protein GCM10017044_26360 [Kordiimonas sediminis]|uniref:DUF445 domain-containing protein n=1 Tax=Kordiimonas sediminis TaxID=1735581 RepID=A0A919AWK5_9PROT|nr:DUF445 domain-containing protein [Kordiimonas sediminis]GHF29808.1 hypothetical protein GCM10017044_26360 [Kordiimonas sediminis]
MTPPTSYASDIAMKEMQLRRYKRYALSLLLLMAATFIGMHYVPEKGPILSLIMSASEAGIVGGLADWFAVTALFRHPMGIPIPHTALIPNNKDRIGNSIGTFIEQHFLNPEEVVTRLNKANIAGRVGAWLSKPENADLISQYILAATPHMVRSLNDDEIRQTVTRVAKTELQNLKVAPFLGDILSVLLKHEQQKDLFSKAVGYVRQALVDHRYRIIEIVEKKSYWWVPASVDKKVAEAILEGALEFVDDLQNEDSEAYQKFDQAVADLIYKLQTSDSFKAQIETFKEKVIEDESASLLLGQIWDRLRDHIISQTEMPSDTLRSTIASGIAGFGQKMQHDPELEARINERLEALVLQVAVPWRRQIGAFIADVVRGWDAKTITNRIELTVGRDLQYVRINGTLVGALVGAIVHCVSTYLLP